MIGSNNCTIAGIAYNIGTLLHLFAHLGSREEQIRHDV